MHLKNIGPISDIEFDVNADLTFIYGENNIGKSYAITIMYLFLKNYIVTPVPFLYRNAGPAMFQWSLDDEIKTFLEKISKEELATDSDITEIITNQLSRVLSGQFSTRFIDSLRSSFGDIANLHNKISNQDLNICVSFENFVLDMSMQNNAIQAKCKEINKKYIFKKSKNHRHPRIDGKNMIIYYCDDEQFTMDLGQTVFLLYKSSIEEIENQVSNVYFLPASRSGLYRALNAFSSILAELAKKRSFLREKITLPSISEQDSDYFAMINEINVRRRSQKYDAVASDIESRLLKGEVSFDPKSKQILFHPKNSEINLELLGTSSMIAEVSPIVIYLRYIVDSVRSNRNKNISAKPIIFIEEPEAHLHPKAQVKLIECFIDLVKTGARLVISSHSNYIFNKLNNLVAEKRIETESLKGFLFFDGEKGSCAQEIAISDFGFEDNNFVDVAEELYKEKLSIIDNME
jgi:predicted ATPase